MKIPNGESMPLGGAHHEEWRKMAAKLSLQHDIFIDVVEVVGNQFSVSEIYFTIGDNKFDNLKELRKALKCKAFL
jgi:hypothetical protein